MKSSEAQDLIAMMAAATQGGAALEPTKQAFWESQLVTLDAEPATAAMLDGIRLWKFFPSWAEFAAAYADVVRRRAAEQELAERTGEYEQRRSLPKHEVPFWVKRWVCSRMLYARFGKDRDERRFAEMDQHVDPLAELMPADAWVEEANQLTDVDAWRAIAEPIK